MNPRTRLLVGLARTAVLLLATVLTLSACGSEESGQSPTKVLSEAKTNLDETSGVHIVLSTEKLPEGVNGIVSADGVGTHAPAFEGDIQVVSEGTTVDTATVAVDGVVYAKLPFTTSFAEIDPADYRAPDPADLMGAEEGLSSLLTEAEDVEEVKQVRDGEAVLTEYAGTVPGDVVASVIPTASAEDSFDATFTVTDDKLLNEALLSGPFYPDAEDVTYTIKFDDYGTDKEITAP